MQANSQPLHQARLRVFLCHSSGDKKLVRGLYGRLKESGFAPWLDEEQLLPGQDWREEIPAAIRACDAVVVCLSHSSVTKEGYLQKEITEALSCAEEKPEGTIFTIPARFEAVEVPKRLSRWQWANLFEDSGYTRIVSALEARARALGIDPTRAFAHDGLLNEAVRDLEITYDLTLEALAGIIDLRDSPARGHGIRVTAYAIALARSMGKSGDEIRTISRAAFLHDIGNIAIPDVVLLKPAKLDHTETMFVQEHCEIGYDTLRKIPFLSKEAEIVYAHHEHYDGTGYPRGLRGSEIPAGARIFAIADALDAITTDRPYRRASSFDVARERIERCSGTQFDPEMVEAFLRLPNELWYELRSEIQRHPMITNNQSQKTDPPPENR